MSWNPFFFEENLQKKNESSFFKGNFCKNQELAQAFLDHLKIKGYKKWNPVLILGNFYKKINIYFLQENRKQKKVCVYNKHVNIIN